MKVIICDRCKKQRPDTYYGTTAEVNRTNIGYPKEFHLCSACTEDFIRWVREGVANHDNRTTDNA